MIKILIPEDKTRKSRIRGFWKNESGHIYYDYLREEAGNFQDLESIRVKYNQEAIFFKAGNNAGVFFNNKKIDILNKCYIIKVKKENLKKAIQHNLKIYGGLSVYIEKDFYIIEIFEK